MKTIIYFKLERLEMLLSELLEKNVSMVGQLSKIESEIVGKIGSLQQSIDDLQAQLSNVALTDEQAASVQAVIDSVNALDNIVPDA